VRGVIDASVMLASLLEDEPDHASARKLLRRFVDTADKLELISISLLPYELASALWQAVRRGRAAAKDIATLLEQFERFGLPLFSVPPASVISVAERLQCASAYDAAYLALAEREKAPLVTADRRLHNALRDKFRWIASVDEFLNRARRENLSEADG